MVTTNVEHMDMDKQHDVAIAERFTPRMPEPVSYGFTAGVLRVAWTREPPFTIAGRDGQVFTAILTEVNVDRSMLPTDAVDAALRGLVVRAPQGRLARITGVERHCTMQQGLGASLGILLVPVEES